MGSSADREFDEKMVHLSLNANPSHLEVVNAVELDGLVHKPKEMTLPKKKVLGYCCTVMLHGRQGIVSEVSAFSN